MIAGSLLQMNDEFAATIGEFRPLLDGWFTVRDKLLDIAAMGTVRCSSWCGLCRKKLMMLIVLFLQYLFTFALFI